jgi:endogenous inhibitor of DNA gyrase (YacG/DUF329 family)
LARPEPLCVYCRRQRIDPAWRPFCSERCRLADLGRWLSEGYRVPGERDEDAAPELPDNVPKHDLDHEDD